MPRRSRNAEVADLIACTSFLATERDAVLPTGAIVGIAVETDGVFALRATRAGATVGVALTIRQWKSGKIDGGRRRLGVARKWWRLRRWRRLGRRRARATCEQACSQKHADKPTQHWMHV